MSTGIQFRQDDEGRESIEPKTRLECLIGVKMAILAGRFSDKVLSAQVYKALMEDIDGIFRK